MDKERADRDTAEQAGLPVRRMPAGMGTVTRETLWRTITAHQGEPFYTKKGLPFIYEVKGGELFTDRRARSITRSTFERAYDKLLAASGGITGPKSLNVYGAPYVWAVLTGIGAIAELGCPGRG